MNWPTNPPEFVKTLTPAEGNGLYILNPYACGLNLSQFGDDNPVRLNPNFWTWEQNNDNYGTWFFDGEVEFIWMGTLGINDANGVVSPGQGFFGQYYNVIGTSNPVRTLSSSTGGDLERVHAHTPVLKSTSTNFLRLEAEGNSSKDEIIVRFVPIHLPI